MNAVLQSLKYGSDLKSDVLSERVSAICHLSCLFNFCSSPSRILYWLMVFDFLIDQLLPLFEYYDKKINWSENWIDKLNEPEIAQNNESFASYMVQCGFICS